MNNKQLQELLKQYPDDMPVIYFHPTKDIQTVDHTEERTITNHRGEYTDVLVINMSNFKY